MDVLGINVENLGHGEQVINRKEPRPVDYVTECERMKKKIEFEEVRGLCRRKLWRHHDVMDIRPS